MANHRKVYLEITNRCNLACSFCPGTSRPARVMSEDEFAFLAARVSDWAEYIFYHLMGEPTAHPLLPRFIEISQSLSMKSIITTNGTLLPQKGDALIAVKPHKVNISVHSLEANGDSARFDEYIEGCVHFTKKAADAGIFVVLRLWNLDGRSVGAVNTMNALILNRFHNAFPDEWVQTRSGYRMRSRVFLEWGDKFDWADINGEVLSEVGFCYGLRDQIGVLCDGTVVPCCLDRNGDIALGNLFELTLQDILFSQRARAIYDGFTHHRCREELCKRCMRAGYYR